jgi:superfamily II DNA/RNA helicase
MNGKRGTTEEATRGRGPEIKAYRICTRTIEILEKSNIKQLFPIQQETFDLVYDGKDIMGRDITGSGKTLAYVLPLVERFRTEGVFEARRRSSDRPHLVIIIVPTRELALQVSTVLEQIKHSDEYRVQAVYGGAPIDPQIDGLRRGAEFVVGTTGRLMDHMERGTLQTRGVRCVVLDEADRMLDMGFQEDVEKIFENIRGLPKDGKHAVPQPQPPPSLQCLLFSATFPSWVQRVAAKYLHPAFTLVDLVKNLTNKTASSVRHYAVLCPYVNRTSILADISKSF